MRILDRHARNVAIGIASYRRRETIALRECDRWNVVLGRAGFRIAMRIQRRVARVGADGEPGGGAGGGTPGGRIEAGRTAFWSRVYEFCWLRRWSSCFG
jgi:hypothetical protein